jgi:hypothetical protein
MEMSEDRFHALSEADRRRYVAQALGCNPNVPDGWPDRLVDDLVSTRLRDGSQQFYLALGTVLGVR